MSRPTLAIGLSVATFCVFGVAAPSLGHAASIDSFEAADAPAPWKFSNGPEFPGARGSLTTTTNGHVSRGVRLTYDFSQGGSYVAMSRSVSAVATGVPLAFWVRADVRTRITLRLADSNGQTVQYDMGRPLECIASGDWCQMVWRSDTSPRDHWGGANDGKLKGTLTSIGIILPKAADAPLTGTVDLDDLAAIDVPAAYVLDPRAPGATLGASSGDLLSRLGVTVHDMSDELALDALQQSGFTWVRTDLFWRYVEKEVGRYDFTSYDRAIDAVERRGMKAIFILDYGNVLYGNGPPRTSEAIEAFGAFAQAAATHFAGRHIIFEVWNEPDGPKFWAPGNKPLEYAVLLQEAIARVHLGDPKAQVSTGGVSWFFYDYFNKMLATGAAEGANFLGVHAYGSTPPEKAVANFVQLRRRTAEFFTTAPPIINTEWGFSSLEFGTDGSATAARARQAVFAVRAQLANWVAGVPVAIWYDVRDGCADKANKECNFGLLANDGTDKPVMRAIRTLTSLARGRTLKSVLSNGVGPHVLRFQGPNDEVIIAWLSEANATATLRTQRPEAATDLYGTALKMQSVDGGLVALTLSESTGPIYLRYPTTTTSSPTAPDAGASTGSAMPDGAPTADVRSNAAANSATDSATDSRLQAADSRLSSDGAFKTADAPGSLLSNEESTDHVQFLDDGPDASVVDSETPRTEQAGCGCSIPRAANSSPLWILLAGATLVYGRRRSARTRGRTTT